jgi:hypothetical protein
MWRLYEHENETWAALQLYESRMRLWGHRGADERIRGSLESALLLQQCHEKAECPAHIAMELTPVGNDGPPLMMFRSMSRYADGYRPN